MTARRWLLGVGAVLVVLAVAVVWLGLSARTVVAELSAARNDLGAGQAALAERDVDVASAAIASAAEHADAAQEQTSSPIWGLGAALPVVGATPEAVRAIATALDQAVADLVPALDEIVAIRPSALIKENGKVDGAAISAALPAMRGALEGISAASATLAAAPSSAAGHVVVGQVDDARAQLAQGLASLEDTLSAAVQVAEIAPPLLGVDEPKRYFVAIQNPNEARGVGGFLGTWAIVTADEGQLTVEDVGSNSDLPSFQSLPIDLGEDFRARYGDDAGYIGNMNISPHFPHAARLWLASWQKKTGQSLDGALSADVVALGELVAASGQKVPLPDGDSLSGTELADFALAGIYEKFPQAAESGARKAYQERIARAAVDVVTAGAAGNPAAMADALAAAISEGRILAWVTDPKLEEQLIATPLGGSLTTEDGPHVAFVAIDSSASKLDTYLARSVRYEVNRCAADVGWARSQVSVTLTNDIPAGTDLPPYVISQAEVARKGPINSVLAQLHLPNGARIIRVQVDGAGTLYTPFIEQGRTSLALDIDLPPRKPRTITVLFDEQLVDTEPTVTEQPLVLPQETEIVTLC